MAFLSQSTRSLLFEAWIYLKLGFSLPWRSLVLEALRYLTPVFLPLWRSQALAVEPLCSVAESAISLVQTAKLTIDGVPRLLTTPATLALLCALISLSSFSGTATFPAVVMVRTFDVRAKEDGGWPRRSWVALFSRGA